MRWLKRLAHGVTGHHRDFDHGVLDYGSRRVWTCCCGTEWLEGR